MRNCQRRMASAGRGQRASRHENSSQTKWLVSKKKQDLCTKRPTFRALVCAIHHRVSPVGSGHPRGTVSFTWEMKIFNFMNLFDLCLKNHYYDVWPPHTGSVSNHIWKIKIMCSPGLYKTHLRRHKWDISHRNFVSSIGGFPSDVISSVSIYSLA